MRVLATAEEHAQSSHALDRVTARRAFLNSCLDSKHVAAVINTVHASTKGYYGVKAIAADLMNMSEASTDISGLKRAALCSLATLGGALANAPRGADAVAAAVVRCKATAAAASAAVADADELQRSLKSALDDGDDGDTVRLVAAEVAADARAAAEKTAVYACQEFEEACSQLTWAAAAVTGPPLSAILARRSLDALDGALADTPGGADAVAAVNGRCDSLVAAAPLAAAQFVVAALEAWASGNPGVVEVRLDDADTAADRDMGALGGLLARAAALATQNCTLLGAVRRDVVALGVLFGDAPGAGEALASLLARCETATNAASVKLAQPLVAVLDALGRGAGGAESQFAVAEAAASGACRDLRALRVQLARAVAVASSPCAGLEAARRDAGALRAFFCDIPGAGDALDSLLARCATAANAASVAPAALLSVLEALGRDDGAKARLDDADVAADVLCRGLRALVGPLARAAAVVTLPRAGLVAARRSLDALDGTLADTPGGADAVAAMVGRCDSLAAAALLAAAPFVVAALDALASGDPGVAKTRLDDAETAVVDACQKTRDFRTRVEETKQRLLALRRAGRTLRDRDRDPVREERERLLATVGPELAEKLTPLLLRFDQDCFAHLGADLLLKVLQVVRAAVDGLPEGDPGRQWA